jgi:hypothetical protein
VDGAAIRRVLWPWMEQAKGVRVWRMHWPRTPLAKGSHSGDLLAVEAAFGGRYLKDSLPEDAAFGGDLLGEDAVGIGCGIPRVIYLGRRVSHAGLLGLL